jgi:hypothetical protein
LIENFDCFLAKGGVTIYIASNDRKFQSKERGPMAVILRSWVIDGVRYPPKPYPKIAIEKAEKAIIKNLLPPPKPKKP